MFAIEVDEEEGDNVGDEDMRVADADEDGANDLI
jgi:hypothetical protein